MNRRTITACVLALGFLAVSGRVALAQDRSNNQNDRQNHGQNNAQDNRQNHTTFNDQDRQATRDWYKQHQKNPGAGWRQKDRLTPSMQGRLRAGQPLDPELRRQMHSLPSGLSQHYGPAPTGYRYGVIGGNVVMYDQGNQVRDVFSLTIQ
jgi:hypothetical protein